MNAKSITTIFMLSAMMVSQSEAQKLFTQKFKSAQEMHAAFKYAPNKKIISGHRGTIEEGMPENSIPAFEAVLRHTPAIFEIDPRLTKDSIPVMVHDADLERTTNGHGKVADYTWKELQKLRLKDHHGNVTNYRINSLDEVIRWAKGKTILNLDKKDLPLEMTAAIIKKHNAYNWVWVTVHNVEQAKFYLTQHPDQYMSMHIKDQAGLDSFDSSGLPYNRMIVYIGPEIKASNQKMYDFFHARGVMCMISSAPTYDKLETKSQRAAKYQEVFESGASILESDLPIEVSQAVK